MTSLIIWRSLVQNYAKKFKNWDCELEIIFFISLFSFWKLKGHKIRIYNGKCTSLDKKITRSGQSWHTWKKVFQNAQNLQMIVKLNRYKIRTNHPFHLKFCTVAPYILTNKMATFFFNFALIYVMTSIIYSNLCEKFVKIQRDIICNPYVCPTGYEFKYFKSIV